MEVYTSTRWGATTLQARTMCSRGRFLFRMIRSMASPRRKRWSELRRSSVDLASPTESQKVHTSGVRPHVSRSLNRRDKLRALTRHHQRIFSALGNRVKQLRLRSFSELLQEADQTDQVQFCGCFLKQPGTHTHTPRQHLRTCNGMSSNSGRFISF